MAGDPPRELPRVPLVPLSSVGALGGPAAAAPPDAGAAFDAETPRLFALAWLITGGHDGAAAHALVQARDRFVTSWTGATDAASDARMLLVPRACKAARRVHPPFTGVDLLDQLFAVQPRARAALVLHEACGLDDAATGQLLEVDLHDAASLQRHALGACRFVGVPELVRATFDEQVARVLAHGAPPPSPPRSRRAPVVVASAVLLVFVAGVLVWRTRHDDAFTPADPAVTHYVALDPSTGWRRDTVDVTAVLYGTSLRLYARAGHDRLLVARLITQPFATRPFGFDAGTDEQVGDHTVEVVSSGSDELLAWVIAPCGSAAIASFGVPRAELVTAAATMRCDPDGSRRVDPPGGLHEHVLPPLAHAFASSANYSSDEGSLLLRAEPAVVEPELIAVRGAHLVRHAGVRYLVSRDEVAGRNPRFTVRWLLDDAMVTLSTLAPLDEAGVLELAQSVRVVDEATFRADPPATTRPR